MKKLLILTTLAALPLAACGGGGGEEGGGADTGNAAAIAAGKTAFTEYTCVTCHGENGKGDGSVGAALPVQPRDYTNAEWQDGITDDQIKAVITKGGEANGLSNLMAAYPTIPAEDLDNLVAFIRSLKQ